MKVFSVVGNRPQFVKAAPTSVALRERGIDEVVLHTGQHYDRELSQVFFDELGLGKPRYRLDAHTADPDAMTPGIADALRAERPDWALVYGDTNSTLAGARAAAGAKVPLAHVDVGDVMADACFRLAPIARERSDALSRLRIEPGRYLLVTVQREANVRPERLR